MKAVATVLDGKIAVKTSGPDFQELLDRCREVGAGKFSKPDKVWLYPLSLDTCHRLRVVWGKSLEVAQPLREWYGQANAKADQRASIDRTADVSLNALPEIAPALAEALRPDQRFGAVWVGEGWRNAALLADQPGTGKTLVTIAGLLDKNVQGPVLISCPRLSTRSVWWRELTRWTDEVVYVARGTRAQRTKAIAEFIADPAARKFLITVSETLRVKEEANEEGKKQFAGYEYPELFDIKWAAVAVDESHKMFGSLTTVRGNLAGKGLKRLQYLPAQPDTIQRLAITGTPFGKGGRVLGMFGSLHWLWPDEFTSFWRWAYDHFEVTEKQVTRTKVVKEIGGLKGGVDEEHFLRSLGPRILRRTKAEVLPWLPPKEYVDVWCEMTPAQEKQYARLFDDAEVVGKSGMVTADGVLAFITRSKQVASGLVDVIDEHVVFTQDSCKIEMLIEKLTARGVVGDVGGDTKVIIASQFNELLDATKERLDKEGCQYLEIRGATSDKKRDQAMATFQSDQKDIRVMVLNSKAGGVSVTLDAADEVHMLDEMWDPGDNEQLEDRIHRASRNHHCTILRYRTENSIDSSIAADVEGKRFEQYRVLDQARDVSYARALVNPKGFDLGTFQEKTR